MRIRRSEALKMVKTWREEAERQKLRADKAEGETRRLIANYGRGFTERSPRLRFMIEADEVCVSRLDSDQDMARRLAESIVLRLMRYQPDRDTRADLRVYESTGRTFDFMMGDEHKRR